MQACAGRAVGRPVGLASRSADRRMGREGTSGPSVTKASCHGRTKVWSYRGNRGTVFRRQRRRDAAR
eukprot:15476449-Alexandrium_andersonii.AAC.1